MSDLFENHIVGFSTKWLIYKSIMLWQKFNSVTTVHNFAAMNYYFPVVSTCNILAEYVVAGYGLISLPSTVKAILS